MTTTKSVQGFYFKSDDLVHALTRPYITRTSRCFRVLVQEFQSFNTFNFEIKVTEKVPNLQYIKGLGQRFPYEAVSISVVSLFAVDIVLQTNLQLLCTFGNVRVKITQLRNVKTTKQHALQFSNDHFRKGTCCLNWNRISYLQL